MTWLSLILLAVSTAIAAIRLGPGLLGGSTIALLAVALGWSVLIALVAPRAQNRACVLVLLFAQQTIAACLMASTPEFFVYAASGFVQAYALLSSGSAFAVVIVTALTIHFVPLLHGGSTEQYLGAATAATLQIVLIGWFGRAAQSVHQQNEERKRLVAELERTVEENRGLHAQLTQQAREAGVQDERQRMAREIHDTIAQGLAGVITQMQAANGYADGSAERAMHLAQVDALARESLMAARSSVAAVDPWERDDQRLPDTIHAVVARWSVRHDTHAHVEVTGEVERMANEIEVVLLRVAQEALANVARHAKATRVVLTLSYSDDAVLLDVRDDGVGAAIPSGDPFTRGYGLAGLRQRLDRVHGTLVVESAPGHGCAVSASVPAIRSEEW